MTGLEKQIWAATFASSYINRMELGRHRGLEPTSDACNQFAATAVDIADSAVFALRNAYEESEFVGKEDVNEMQLA